MDLPPDRADVLAERRNPYSQDLHRLGVAGIVELIQRQDYDVLAALEQARPALIRVIEAAEPGFRRGGRLIYLGAGTSGRLGVLDAAEAPPTFQVPLGRVVGLIAGGEGSLRASSEGREDDPQGAREDLEQLALGSDDCVIAIAAGGTTPYALGGLSIAKRLCPGVTTVLLSCSPVAQPPGADHLLVIASGPEVLTGSTRMKAGTATKLALNTISTTLMVRAGKVYQNLMVDVRASNAKLQDRAARIISTLTGLERSQAFLLLERAGGKVKTAVVMHRRQLDAAEADACLERSQGRLDVALGEAAG